MVSGKGEHLSTVTLNHIDEAKEEKKKNNRIPFPISMLKLCIYGYGA